MNPLALMCLVVTMLALPSAHAAAPAVTLAPPASFAGIADPATRSAAYFTELYKVLSHPRCTNCHPVGERPSQGQGDTLRLHQPPVVRGADGTGTAAMRCRLCHGPANFEPAGVPGHPHWHLAPPGMAWQGKTAGEICVQVKDPARNGGRTLAAIAEHIGRDTLVGWAWSPGGTRTAAPGTQEGAGALVEAWIATGAACPP